MMVHVVALHLNRISSGIYYSSILFPPLISLIIFFYSSIFHLAVFIPSFSYRYHFPCFYILVLWVCWLVACCYCAHPIILALGAVCMYHPTIWLVHYFHRSISPLNKTLLLCLCEYTSSSLVPRSSHRPLPNCFLTVHFSGKAREHEIWIHMTWKQGWGYRELFQKQCMGGYCGGGAHNLPHVSC